MPNSDSSNNKTLLFLIYFGTLNLERNTKMAYIDDLTDIWEQIKQNLAKRIAPSTLDLWFGDFKIVEYKDNTIVFSTESEFKYKIAHEKYIKLLEDEFEAFFGFSQKIDVIFVGIPSEETISKQYKIKLGKYDYREKKDDEPQEETPKSGTEELYGEQIKHNFQYTFDNFIVGTSNKFAHAACTAVAAHPASNYNPLFIYGPSGLGKTHLMSAIVNEIKTKAPNAKVIYIKGEDFTNEMIECLSNREMNKFHEKYRKCDVLLIDDIQFIAGKASTQEEFFHTFNTLHESNRQIVLSSDRPPRDIALLEDRLKTRFEWGLIADIQPPDLELRIAIIKKKAEQVSITLSDEVLTFLAENLRSNIRQIEGTVKKLSAMVFLQGKTITMDVAASCLQEITGGVVPNQVIIDKIFSCIYDTYGYEKKDIIGLKRTKDLAFARHVAIYVIRDMTEMSYPSIAKIFNRDHSTIISSCELIEKKKVLDPLLAITISNLEKDVQEL